MTDGGGEGQAQPYVAAQARALVKAHEGLVLEAQPDRGGAWSIGWGHDGARPGDVWTEAQAESAFQADFDKALVGAVQALGPADWQRLDEVRQGVLVDMAFELGARGLREFQGLLAAIRRGDWASAQREGLWDAPGVPTPWHKQVPARALEDMEMMLSGKWPKELEL